MTHRYFLHSIAVIFALCAFAASEALGAIVTVDMSKNAAVCDSKAFTVMVYKIVDNQVSLHIAGESPLPQKIVLKISGLQPGEQDWYLNGSYKGKKPDTEFAAGVTLSIPGRAISPDLLRCLISVQDRVNAEIAHIKDNKEDEHQRVMNTLDQAKDWVESAQNSDKWARSIDVVVAPGDMALLVKSGTSIRTAEEAQQAYVSACHLFQQARDRMYDKILDPVLRNETVVSLTPIDLKFSYYLVNGKAKGTALVVNNSNIPITGKVTPVVPKAWKVGAKTLSFSNLASGKSFKVDFALVPPGKGQTPPASLSIQAAITFGYDPFWAGLTLTAEAAKGATAVAPVVPKPHPKPEPSPRPAPKPSEPAGATPLNGPVGGPPL